MKNIKTIEDHLIELGRRIESQSSDQLIHPDQSTLLEWRGADTRITSDFTPSTPDFFEHDLMVYTHHARLLSWLFFELRDTFADELSAKNKYGFFGTLAQIAMAHLAQHQPEPDDYRPLLKAVLSQGFGFLERLRHQGSLPKQSEIVLHDEDSEGRQRRIDAETDDETV
ncbi:MAG: hypothetical protein Q8M02_15600 [Candidatus Didemnitutus sp.]|nr:hypothetical protein [Candidatus Didemnitutus sp.]